MKYLMPECNAFCSAFSVDSPTPSKVYPLGRRICTHAISHAACCLGIVWNVASSP